MISNNEEWIRGCGTWFWGMGEVHQGIVLMGVLGLMLIITAGTSFTFTVSMLRRSAQIEDWFFACLTIAMGFAALGVSYVPFSKMACYLSI